MSRPELIQLCMELGIDWQGLSIEQLKAEIRKAADKKFKGKKGHYSADSMSKELKKFLTKEYDYVLRGKDGEKIKI